MTDILDKIDASLEEVEEQLLAELNRAGTSGGVESWCEIDIGIRNSLQEIATDIHDLLQNSGDRVNLQLITERHEVLYARIGVIRQLLSYRIPTHVFDEAHEGVEERRRMLEQRVIQQRRNRTSAQDAIGPGIFDHNPSRQEVQRNRLGVTHEEAEQLEPAQAYLDNGIYSASRELAILASLIRGGTLDTPPDGDPQKSRAVFTARDLSARIPHVNKRPRAPNEPVPQVKAKPRQPEERDIAQTPEEIKRKLEARRGQTSGAGKAVFSSKDIPHVSPREAPLPKPAPESEPPANTGKAIFAAKDVKHAMPHQYYGRKRRDEDRQEPKNEDKPRTGRAVFEARDLSQPPFPKKKN